MEISNPINKDSAITPFWFVSITSKTPYSTHQFLDSYWNGRHPAILNLVWKEQKKKKIAYTILLAYNPNHNLKLQWERWGLEEKFTHGNLQGGVFFSMNKYFTNVCASEDLCVLLPLGKDIDLLLFSDPSQLFMSNNHHFGVHFALVSASKCSSSQL